MLTQARLREVLDYDPATGAFKWKVMLSSRGPIGSAAGCYSRKGYWRIRVDGREYMAHRLAWLHVTGAWPPDQIDHRNTKRDDNRFDNLRLATNGQNGGNRRLSAKNRTGFKGVSVSRSCPNKPCYACINVNGRTKKLGHHATPEAAHAAYLAAAVEHFGPFVRVN